MTERKSQTKTAKGNSISIELAEFLSLQKIGQAAFARRIGVSPATINLFLKDKYPGDNDKLTKEIIAEIDTVCNLPKRYKQYIIGYLGRICEDCEDIIQELQHNRIHPSQNHNPEERIVFLQKLIDEKLDYVWQILVDLKRIN